MNKTEMYLVIFDGKQIAWFYTTQDAFRFVTKTYGKQERYRATVSRVREND